ncbi:3-methylcrotonyl-CoA carboxylase alpha subunit [Litoreibacter ponti]|uniref:3-methylcrotonyl-CoA carboxylase alpha subunit n=1 Tax=Litoreibacter ponti TaxID=1510457 RepID=A0A2T6BKI5_9RHOB|nr:acetyl/propionyl/methylcrotonyl-CoA carboxylase subunit alpha [Litoreibacter ponti]PTX56573.1 3-methylcrotonyl-CoA carboxylase alpha subunit [Litoreibacter ponti]
MFRKILIANRGEIACRVIETCRRLGVATVAVHSDIDRAARHVAMADEAVSLGGASPAESYLRGDAIIEAAIKTGAQAIHPGYGFLSENPDFVDAVEAAGLVFIGPSADAIRAMGLKDAAKSLMEKAGVPVVPGYHGAAQDNLAAEADKIGYPVLIKAVAGGGGKGMRRVERAQDFAQELEAAQTEAQKAFGNADVLVEKYVSTPRHIEVQVFGDGNDAVHLFERDCSLQRRHQKVIEEAPAPGMTDEMRAAMGEAAVRAAKAVGYAGAGTVEFIVDASDGLRADRFYFMEMNTRLQVEHPVTEEITGVDLVEWQLRVASGEALPLLQDQLSITGHAFEARIYAEDVAAGFLPAIGTLGHLRFADGARIDTGVRPGDEISPHYDPMIAKLTVHGPDRAAALAQLTRALQATEIGGTVTNIGFLAALSQHEGFSVGEVDTGLIARDLDTLVETPAPCTRTQALAGIAALGLDGDAPEFAGFSLWGAEGQSVDLQFGEAEVTASITTLGPGQFRVEVGGETHQITRTQNAWTIGDDTIAARVWCDGRQGAVFWGNTYAFTVPDPLDRHSDAASDGLTRAPMPGLVRVVDVTAGQQVAKGDRLLVLEAMKMEHALRADADGIVADVMVEGGAQVVAGAPLVRIEAKDG